EENLDSLLKTEHQQGQPRRGELRNRSSVISFKLAVFSNGKWTELKESFLIITQSALQLQPRSPSRNYIQMLPFADRQVVVLWALLNGTDDRRRKLESKPKTF
ncbi:hypothetical protein GOODEAATRI_002241, partial [Goodea atripinnis]